MNRDRGSAEERDEDHREDAPVEADSAGVYFMPREEFEWRPAKAHKDQDADHLREDEERESS